MTLHYDTMSVMKSLTHGKMTATYYNLNLLASTYGSGTYDGATYNGQTTSTSGSGSAGSGPLTDTGIAIASITTVAAAILLTALVVRIWKRPGKRASQSVEKQLAPKR